MKQTILKQRDVGYTEDLILESLGLNKSQLLPNIPIKSIHAENSYVLVPVKNVKILDRLNPDFRMMNKISRELDFTGYYVFTTGKGDKSHNATARIFRPGCRIQKN